jgi:hypothetical protein
LSPSSGTPSSLRHSVTTISLRYLRPLRSIIVPSIHSFIRRASGFPQHKYLRHFISLRLYLFHFAGSISAYTHPLLRLMLPLLNQNPLFVSFRSYYTHAFQLCSFACPQCYASYTAATPDLFVGCLLHCIPLRSPFCR